VYADIQAGASPKGATVDVAGEQVAVKDHAAATTAAPEVSPRDRWKAVARVECGEKPVDVARDIGVNADELRGWYTELRQAALDLWATEASKH
jgi:hypothetical protein